MPGCNSKRCKCNACDRRRCREKPAPVEPVCGCRRCCQSRPCCDKKCEETFRADRIQTKKLEVKKILPRGPCATVGTAGDKFKSVYTEDLYVDLETIHFGDEVTLSTTSDGRFFATADGGAKRFFAYRGDPDLVGPVAEKGEKGDVGPVGPAGNDGADSALIYGENDELTAIRGARNLPCNGLSLLYFDTNTNEISYDDNLPSYSELVDLVNTLVQEVAQLSAQN